MDLSQTSAGAASLVIRQRGVAPQSLALTVLPPRAQIRSVEHAELDTTLKVTGEHLERMREYCRILARHLGSDAGRIFRKPCVDARMRRRGGSW